MGRGMVDRRRAVRARTDSASIRGHARKRAELAQTDSVARSLNGRFCSHNRKHDDAWPAVVARPDRAMSATGLRNCCSSGNSSVATSGGHLIAVPRLFRPGLAVTDARRCTGLSSANEWCA
jgi:hypothetical protein